MKSNKTVSTQWIKCIPFECFNFMSQIVVNSMFVYCFSFYFVVIVSIPFVKVTQKFPALLNSMSYWIIHSLFIFKTPIVGYIILFTLAIIKLDFSTERFIFFFLYSTHICKLKTHRICSQMRKSSSSFMASKLKQWKTVSHNYLIN